MLLHRYPEVGKVFVLLRPGTGGDAPSPLLRQGGPEPPLRAASRVARRRDSRPSCARSASRSPATSPTPCSGSREEDLAALEAARRRRELRRPRVLQPVARAGGPTSTRCGAGHAAEVCRRTGAALLHVSTCYVAGNRDGVVFEDEEIVGYFPRRDGLAGRPKERPLAARDFDLEAELADCDRRIALVREQAEDRALTLELPGAGAGAARARRGATPRDEKTLRLAVGRESGCGSPSELVRAGHGARPALGLAQHLHVHQVARRAGHRRRRRASATPSSARPSWRARCATRSPAGTRASPPRRRWPSLGAQGPPRATRPARRPSSTSSRWTWSRPASLIAIAASLARHGDLASRRASTTSPPAT